MNDLQRAETKVTTDTSVTHCNTAIHSNPTVLDVSPMVKPVNVQVLMKFVRQHSDNLEEDLGNINRSNETKTEIFREKLNWCLLVKE